MIEQEWHIIIVFNCVQSYPGKEIFSGGKVLVVWLMHMPYNGYIELVGHITVLILWGVGDNKSLVNNDKEAVAREYRIGCDR